MSLRVLGLVPHPLAGASSRYRAFQMREPLAREGVDLEVRPFLDDAAFARLYRSGHWPGKFVDIARGWRRRARDFADASGYDLAFVHREIVPIVGGDPVSSLARSQPRWVFDLDDAVWLPNVSEANAAFVRLKPFAHAPRLAAGARAVSAGNAMLAEWARAQRPGADPAGVAVVPTAIDVDRWRPRSGSRSPGPPRLVWIGSPSTVPHLEALGPVLARLASRGHAFEVHVIGGLPRLPGVEVVVHAWSSETEHHLVAEGDIGLAPLPDTLWTRGKCGLKLLLTMASGLASVASDVGAHRDIVRDGVDGCLARDDAAFESALERLLGDPALRARLAAAGRERVASGFSLPVVAGHLSRLMHRAVDAA